MPDFKIRVIVDPTQAKRGVATVTGEMNRLTSSADRARNVLARTFAVVGLGAGIIGSIRLLADFSQEMSTVKAVSQATEAQFGALRDEAKRLGSTTRFSATQAAEGMTFLARAGFEAEEVLATIGDTLLLAQAGALGLGRAADIASNVLKGFRLEVDQTSRVVDVLALTASSSNTTVEQLGDAMKFAGPVASGLGVSLEEAAAGAAVLSDAGLQASMAGVGLRRVMAELESPSAKSRKLLLSLGLSTDEYRISSVGLTTALERLKVAGVDTGRALEIFGDRGGPAFEVLGASIPDIKEMNAALLEADGTARRIATTMDDNLNGAILSARSALEGFIIALGDSGATGALEAAFRSLAGTVRFLTEHIDSVLFATNALIVLWGVRLSNQVIPLLITRVKALTAAIAANPFGAMAIAVIAVTTVIYDMSDAIKLTSDRYATMGDLGNAIWKDMKESVGTFIDEGLVAVGDAIEWIGQLFGPFELNWVSVFRLIAQGLDIVTRKFRLTFTTTLTLFTGLPGAIAEYTIDALNKLIEFAEDTINVFVRALNVIRRAIGTAAVELVEFDGVENAYEGAGERLGKALVEGFKSAVTGTPFADLLERSLVEAESVAIQREGPRAKPRPLRIAPPPDGGGGGGAGGAADAEFDRILAQLQSEGVLLQANRQEREILGRVLQIETELKRELTITEEGLIRSQIEFNQRVADEAMILDQLRGPQEDVIRLQEAWNRMLALGRVSVEEYNEAMQDLRIQALELDTSAGAGMERFFLKLAQGAKSSAEVMEEVMGGALGIVEDAWMGFIETGSISLADLEKQLLAFLSRLAFQQITAQVAGAIGGMAFASGGSFMVGANTAMGDVGGIDNRLVMFRARDGERVTVEKPGGGAGADRKGAPGVTIGKIEVNVRANNPSEFAASADQVMRQTFQSINRATRRNGR